MEYIRHRHPETWPSTLEMDWVNGVLIITTKCCTCKTVYTIVVKEEFGYPQSPEDLISDRKSTRLNSVTNAHLVCRLLLEKKKQTLQIKTLIQLHHAVSLFKQTKFTDSLQSYKN